MKLKIASQILLTTGIISMIVGLVGAGLTYRDMKTENLLHARTGIINIKLSETSGWKSEDFALYRPGEHILYLSTVNAFGKPNPKVVASREAVKYAGQFEVLIREPDGHIIVEKRVTSDAIDLALTENMAWTVLDTLQVQDPPSGVWNIQARVLEPDTSFSGTSSEIGILPPQKYDIGWYLYGQTFKLIGFGILGLLGFFLTVLGGHLRSRSTLNKQRSSTPGA